MLAAKSKEDVHRQVVYRLHQILYNIWCKINAAYTKNKGLDRIGERREPRVKKNYAGIGKQN